MSRGWPVDNFVENVSGVAEKQREFSTPRGTPGFLAIEIT